MRKTVNANSIEVYNQYTLAHKQPIISLIIEGAISDLQTAKCFTSCYHLPGDLFGWPSTCDTTETATSENMSAEGEEIVKKGQVGAVLTQSVLTGQAMRVEHGIMAVILA